MFRGQAQIPYLRTKIVVLAFTVVFLVSGCANNAVVAGSEDSVLSLHPHERVRVLATSYNYFRRITSSFYQEVCRQLQHNDLSSPVVGLHGDAHVEQFSVTEYGYGLSDYDSVVSGPAAVDLVRFATSLVLAARTRQDYELERKAIQALRDGYYAGVVRGSKRVAPDFVHRVKNTFAPNPAGRVERIESQLKPVTRAQSIEVRRAFGQYLAGLPAAEQARTPGRFQIISIGALGGGIGSAGTSRYLVRIRGATDDSGDDDFIEMKETGNYPVRASCLEQGQRDWRRIAQTEQTMALAPDRLVGSCLILGRSFWLHAWAHNYVEFDVDRTDWSAKDLVEVARVSGIELGHGHAEWMRRGNRREVLRLVHDALFATETMLVLARRMAAFVEGSRQRAIRSQ